VAVPDPVDARLLALVAEVGRVAVHDLAKRAGLDVREVAARLAALGSAGLPLVVGVECDPAALRYALAAWSAGSGSGPHQVNQPSGPYGPGPPSGPLPIPGGVPGFPGPAAAPGAPAGQPYGQFGPTGQPSGSGSGWPGSVSGPGAGPHQSGPYQTTGATSGPGGVSGTGGPSGPYGVGQGQADPGQGSATTGHGPAGQAPTGQGSTGHGSTGQGSAGQGHADYGQAGQGQFGPDQAGQGRLGQGQGGPGHAGYGHAGPDQAGQGHLGQGQAGQGHAGYGHAGPDQPGHGHVGQGYAGQGGPGQSGHGHAGQGQAGQGPGGRGQAGLDPVGTWGPPGSAAWARGDVNAREDVGTRTDASRPTAAGAAATPTPVRRTGSVGETLHTEGLEGEPLTIQLVEVVDPADFLFTAAGYRLQPGERSVVVHTELTNRGSVPFSSLPDLYLVLLDDEGQSVAKAPVSLSSRPPHRIGVKPGETAGGHTVYVLPEATELAAVRWSPRPDDEQRTLTWTVQAP